MGSLKAIWTNGQVVLKGLADWPEGHRLIVEEENPAAVDFMTEEEQSDAPDAIERWINDLRTIPPVPQNPANEAEWRVWEEKIRVFNVEAVSKQFDEPSL